jgi:hypothetical protein
MTYGTPLPKHETPDQLKQYPTKIARHRIQNKSAEDLDYLMADMNCSAQAQLADMHSIIRIILF